MRKVKDKRNQPNNVGGGIVAAGISPLAFVYHESIPWPLVYPNIYSRAGGLLSISIGDMGARRSGSAHRSGVGAHHSIFHSTVAITRLRTWRCTTLHIVRKLGSGTPGPGHLGHGDGFTAVIGYHITEAVGYRTSIWVIILRLAVRASVVTVGLIGVKVGKWGNGIWVVSCANGRRPNGVGISSWARSACQIEVGLVFSAKARTSGGMCRQSVDVISVSVKLRPLDGFVCESAGQLNAKLPKPVVCVLTIIEV